jgi:hypothetical protein
LQVFNKKKKEKKKKTPFLCLLLLGFFFPQTKRCGDMARKLGFFQDQLVKAQLVPAVRPLTDADEIDFEELEVMF